MCAYVSMPYMVCMGYGRHSYPKNPGNDINPVEAYLHPDTPVEVVHDTDRYFYPAWHA